MRGLTAQQATVPTTVTFSTGATWRVPPGDWIIMQGETVVDVCGAAAFKDKFEIVVDGTLIPRSICTEIEETTGIGSTRNPDELLKAIQRLAKISIGHVQIIFTPGQLEELLHRASKRGYSVQQEIERIVDRIKDELFFRS